MYVFTEEHLKKEHRKFENNVHLKLIQNIEWKLSLKNKTKKDMFTYFNIINVFHIGKKNETKYVNYNTKLGIINIYWTLYQKIRIFFQTQM